MEAFGFDGAVEPTGDEARQLVELGTLVLADDVIPAHIVTPRATELVWEFPVHRFVEYEPKDEAWARPLGYGREIDKPAVFKTARFWWVHPDLVHVFRAAFKRNHDAMVAMQREYFELRGTLTRLLNW